MDWVQAGGLVQTVGGVCGALSFVGTLYLRGTFVTRELHQRSVATLEQRVTECERNADRETGEVKISLALMKGVTSRLDATTARLERQIDRMESIFLNERAG
jgi:hypothetical protein